MVDCEGNAWGIYGDCVGNEGVERALNNRRKPGTWEALTCGIHYPQNYRSDVQPHLRVGKGGVVGEAAGALPSSCALITLSRALMAVAYLWGNRKGMSALRPPQHMHGQTSSNPHIDLGCAFQHG